jgi:hypothetical protein
MLTAA